MGALLKFERKLNTVQLLAQLDYAFGVIGRARTFLEDYLLNMQIDDLGSITVTELLEYQAFVLKMPFTKAKKSNYEKLLEQACFAYFIAEHKSLYVKAENVLKERAIRNKTVGFMLMNDVTDFEEINYDLRQAYEKYLEQTVAPNKVRNYLKALDKLKLEGIHESNQDNPFLGKKLSYENKPVFLLYHPSYDIAMSFYYIRDKEELLFDFSIVAPVMMKRQIFRMLNQVLGTNDNWHDRRERFLLPLKWLFEFCCEEKIEDIEQLTDEQIESFRNRIECKSLAHTDVYMQLVDNIRKYLFLDAKEINWHANVWYLERFRLEEGRVNPAREVKSFAFGQIKNVANRENLKKYMKYLIGISNKLSIQTIRCKYYDVCDFLEFLDDESISIAEITQETLETYTKLLEEKELQAISFNRKISAVAGFYGYLSSRYEYNARIEFRYFYKKALASHNDRSVSLANQMEILGKLGEFPVDLRMMFLNLLCAGLRISEVCTLKGNAYQYDGTDTWLRVYQPKMRTEKSIPIPAILYEVMTAYINEHHIAGDEYVFRSCKGGAYNATTFSKKFKQWMIVVGITDYDFRAHDFRHTLATALYEAGVPIEAVRDYLGHKTSDMTREYLDYMNDRVDKANERYFAQNKGLLQKKDVSEHECKDLF